MLGYLGCIPSLSLSAQCCWWSWTSLAGVTGSGLGVNLILSRLAARNSCGSSTRGKVSERSESLSVLDLNQYRHDRLVGVPLEEPRAI